jgi:small subunit ribosomal protein S8
MPVTDPIADMLTSIRNAAQASHPRVDVPASRVKSAIADLLLREKYIENVRPIEDEKQGLLRIYLRYLPDNRPIIRGIRRVSRPGRRMYCKRHEVPRVLGGLGTAVLSTSQGIMTDKEARKRGLGGELVAVIW